MNWRSAAGAAVLTASLWAGVGCGSSLGQALRTGDDATALRTMAKRPRTLRPKAALRWAGVLARAGRPRESDAVLLATYRKGHREALVEWARQSYLRGELGTAAALYGRALALESLPQEHHQRACRAWGRRAHGLAQLGDGAGAELDRARILAVCGSAPDFTVSQTGTPGSGVTSQPGLEPASGGASNATARWPDMLRGPVSPEACIAGDGEPGRAAPAGEGVGADAGAVARLQQAFADLRIGRPYSALCWLNRAQPGPVVEALRAVAYSQVQLLTVTCPECANTDGEGVGRAVASREPPRGARARRRGRRWGCASGLREGSIATDPALLCAVEAKLFEVAASERRWWAELLSHAPESEAWPVALAWAELAVVDGDVARGRIAARAAAAASDDLGRAVLTRYAQVSTLVGEGGEVRWALSELMRGGTDVSLGLVFRSVVQAFSQTAHAEARAAAVTQGRDILGASSLRAQGEFAYLLGQSGLSAGDRVTLAEAWWPNQPDLRSLATGIDGAELRPDTRAVHQPDVIPSSALRALGDDALWHGACADSPAARGREIAVATLGGEAARVSALHCIGARLKGSARPWFEAAIAEGRLAAGLDRGVLVRDPWVVSLLRRDERVPPGYWAGTASSW